MSKVILMDTSLCVECQACRIACQNHNQLSVTQAYIKFKFVEQGEYPKVNHFISRYSCLHCTDAACINVCPTGTLYKGQSGLTYVQKEKCSGCGYCTSVCPYDVADRVDNVISKCEGCYELVELGETPACVSTCISTALKFGDREEMITQGQERVLAIKGKNPNANLYGAQQLGGLGVLMVLRDKPEVFGLPTNPQINSSLGLWKEVIQPGGLLLAAAAFVTTGASYFVAKRNHEKELYEDKHQKK